MKKITLLIISALFFATSIGQVSLNTAVDFTVTDYKGVEHNLFSYLDDGKLVCLDFFYKDCPACAQTAPFYQSAFEYYGCNTGNVIFLALSGYDNNSTLEAYAQSKGYDYPMVSPADGASSVLNSYPFGGYPTYFLIKPDRTIVEKDIWPVSSAQTFINKINPQGGEQKDCETTGIEDNTKISFTTFPNPVSDNLHISTSGINSLNIELVDILGKTVLKERISSNDGQFSISLKELNSGIYFVKYFDRGQTLGTSKIIKE